MTLSYILVVTILFSGSLSIGIDKKNLTYDLRLAPKLFKDFQTYYNKAYKGEEEEEKSKVFRDNLVRINSINQNFPGSWLAVIGPYADLTYKEFIKLFNFTEANYTDIGKTFRNVINCTKRRGYLFERFSEKVKIDHDNALLKDYYSDEEYSSEENDNIRTTPETGV